MSKVWPGQSFSSSDMTKRVWIKANSDFLEPTRWLFNVSSGISSERINPVHLKLSLTVLDLLRAKQICKRKKLNIKMKKQQARWAEQTACLELGQILVCFTAIQMTIYSDISSLSICLWRAILLFQFSVRIGTLFGCAWHVYTCVRQWCDVCLGCRMLNRWLSVYLLVEQPSRTLETNWPCRDTCVSVVQ